MKINNAQSILAVTVIKVLIYGFPGSRKTAWSMTAKRPLLRDFDNGIRRVGAKFRKSYTDPLRNWPDAIDLGTEEQLAEIDTLITDTAGKAVDVCAEHIKRTNPKLKRSDGNLSIQGYGTLAITFRSGYYNALEATGKDLVFVCHHKEEKGQKDETFYRPDVTGQTLSMLIREMDLVGFIHIRDSKPCITFTPTEDYFAKNSANLPQYMFLDEWTLEQVMDTFRESVNADSSEHAAYMEQISQIATLCDQSYDAISLNAAVEHCMNLSKASAWIYTAQLEARQLINMKGQELKLEKAKTGFYVIPEQTPPPADEAPKPEATAPNHEGVPSFATYEGKIEQPPTVAFNAAEAPQSDSTLSINTHVTQPPTDVPRETEPAKVTKLKSTPTLNPVKNG